MINMELNEIPSTFGIQKNFSIKSLENPSSEIKKILKKNIISYDCFALEKGKPQGFHIVVILYRKGNKECLCLSYYYYRKLSQALKKKVDNKYM